MNINHKYMLVAYKPSSDDYCMGCHMASYSSDFVHLLTDDFDEVVEKLAEIYAYIRDTGEAGYEDIYVYGPSDEDVERVMTRSRERAEEIKQERIRLEKKAREEQEKKIKAEELEKKRKQYEELKKEFDQEGTK